MLLREFLPDRSAQDIWAGQVRVTLGERAFALRVLPIRRNEEWKQLVLDEAAQLFLALDGMDSWIEVMRVLTSVEVGTLMRLLRAYDRDGVLPDDDWIGDNATESDILRAFCEVFATANPTLAVAIDTATRNMEVAALIAEGLSSTGSRPSTDGTSDTSADDSPTSSSSPTSTPGPSDDDAPGATASKPTASGPSRPGPRRHGASGRRPSRMNGADSPANSSSPL